MAFFPKVRQLGLLAFLSMLAVVGVAEANPTLVVDLDSGDVLYQEQATAPWFPASTTKLMTVYVALNAVREGRITMDTPLMVSPRAASMPPSKMGFRPGTLVTLGNALQMLMVKSPNDVAITIAEGISGSVEGFADDMNTYASRLGLHESHFMNPNGLPDGRHWSSARDMAIITRALLHDFPEERPLFGIGMLAFGNQRIHNHNGLLGRYPGVFGMKTGFTCAGGFNIVATAEENGRRLAVIVMGAPTVPERDLRVAVLLDRFLPRGGQSIGTIDTLPASDIVAPPDNHDIACGRSKRIAIEEGEHHDAELANGGQPVAPGTRPVTRMAEEKAYFEPVRVNIGPVPGWSGRIAQAVGGGAKEYPAPTAKAESTDEGTAPDTIATGAVEGAPAAPAPLALVGATAAAAPAALATKRFVHPTRTLSLAVRSSRHGHAAKVAEAAPRPVARPSAKAHGAARPAKKAAVARSRAKPVAAKAAKGRKTARR